MPYTKARLDVTEKENDDKLDYKHYNDDKSSSLLVASVSAVVIVGG